MSTRQSAADRVGSSSAFGRAALARRTRGQLIAAAVRLQRFDLPLDRVLDVEAVVAGEGRT
ncbi:hypothetical protein ABTX82_39230 [Streptomyces lavendulae]|uniref:hypothetical protein n=1 Tax=Streptomyces lavendulae TaxID=1914 RepID=UPI0033264A96